MWYVSVQIYIASIYVVCKVLRSLSQLLVCCVSVQMLIGSVGVVRKCSDVNRECWCDVEVLRCLSRALLWCVRVHMCIPSVIVMWKCSDIYPECWRSV